MSYDENNDEVEGAEDFDGAEKEPNPDELGLMDDDDDFGLGGDEETY